jgi:hypothetical protein
VTTENARGANKALQARNAATAALIEAHQDEWNDRMASECEARGIVWNRPLTPEQRAANDIAVLLEKFPHLREQIASGEVQTQGIRAV